MSSMLHAAKMLEKYWGNNDDYELIEFGICLGNTGKELMDNLKSLDCHFNKFWLVDSFEGLPENNEEAWNWFPGQFNMQKIFNADVESIKSSLYNHIYNGFMDIEFIKSWYKDLTTEQAKQMKPMAFVHIDSDLYISAYQALDWLCSNKLIGENTIILYDDWGRESPDGYGNRHEGRAHLEITQKYWLKWEYLDSEWLDKKMNCSFRLLGNIE